MSDETKPGQNLDSGKTIDEKVTSPEAAPKAGVEREDAQQSGEIGLDQVDAPAVEPYVVKHSQGMWGKTSPDTSGYAGMMRSIEFPGVAQRPYGGWFDQVADRLDGANRACAEHPGVELEVVRGAVNTVVDGLNPPRA